MAKTIGRYEIREELGRGGMAAVYLAIDSRLNREVALKLLDQQLSSDPAFTTRFEREAKTVASLEHSTIVPLYDFGEADGWLYLVMRYMKGGTLKQLIAKGALLPQQAAYVVRRMGAALDKAHGQGIIHRDLKPANILLDEDQKPYLSDFGIVKVAQGDTEYITETGQTLGTYAYMSPEQLLGKEINGQSDIYTLGIVLYEMLIGVHPYAEEATTSAAMAIAHAQSPVPRASEADPTLPPAIDGIIQKAMAKDPNDRYASGSEMTQAVQAVLNVPSPAAMAGVAAAAAATAVKSPPVQQPAPAPKKTPPPQAQQPASRPPAQQVAGQPAAAPPAAKRKRRIPIWLIAVVGVAILSCICLVIVGSSILGDIFGSSPPTRIAEIAAEVAVEEPAEELAVEPVAEPELSLTIWADDARAPILSALAEEFEAAYDVGLNVELVMDIPDQLPIAAPAGEGPDIFMWAHDRLGGWVDSGLAAPIDLGEKEGDFVQVGLDAFTLGGELYGMPYAVENIALFRNVDLVPDAPETWDDLLAAGQMLLDSGDVIYAFALEDSGYMVYPVLTSFGGYVFGRDEDGTWNPNDLGVGSEGMIAAGDWIADNVAAGLISPNAYDHDTAQTLFASGEVPFLMTGPWALEQFRDAGINYAISPFPSDGQPFGGVQGFMINAFSPNVLLAQTFLTDFVATDEVMTELYLSGDRPSAYAPVLAATDDPDLVAFGEAGQNAALMPAIPEMGAVWDSWNNAVVLTITGEDTPENAFTTAAAQIREVLGGAMAGMVNVPGSYQAAAGCDGDWDPACEVTALTEGDDGLFTGSHEIPAGDYEAKVALDGSWNVNYGVDGVPDGDNYTFSLVADGTVSFSYDPATNILTIIAEQ